MQLDGQPALGNVILVEFARDAVPLSVSAYGIILSIRDLLGYGTEFAAVSGMATIRLHARAKGKKPDNIAILVLK